MSIFSLGLFLDDSFSHLPMTGLDICFSCIANDDKIKAYFSTFVGALFPYVFFSTLTSLFVLFSCWLCCFATHDVQGIRRLPSLPRSSTRTLMGQRLALCHQDATGWIQVSPAAYYLPFLISILFLRLPLCVISSHFLKKHSNAFFTCRLISLLHIPTTSEEPQVKKLLVQHIEIAPFRSC